MPIYVYQCKECEKKQEVLQKLNDPPPTSCSHCGKEDCLKKIPASADVHLKGTGWYSDGYQ